MIEELFKNKPNSIHDVIPSEFFTKYDSYDYVWSGNCFEWYYAIAKTIKPKTFMEIGVRFGFSFLPTMLGSENLEYALGWDLETYGNNEIARNNIGEYYKGNCKWEIEHLDSQEQTQLPQFFDLVSIDGCHDYNCKIHDLKLAMENSHYVILDDYDYHTDVRNSVSQFMRDYSNRIEWALYIPTFRGSQLIKFKHDK
jgi:predicted O-methyltransferase YrrM